MDPLQVFLAVVLVIGFALVLYTAPIKYTWSQKVLLTAGGGIFILVALWHAGVRVTFVMIRDCIEPAKMDLAQTKVQKLQVPQAYELGALAVYGSYWFYVQLLRAVKRMRQARDRE